MASVPRYTRSVHRRGKSRSAREQHVRDLLVVLLRKGLGHLVEELAGMRKVVAQFKVQKERGVAIGNTLYEKLHDVIVVQRVKIDLCHCV